MKVIMKKQDSTTHAPTATREWWWQKTTTEPAAETKPHETASESQPSGEEGCPKKDEPPITIEAVFLGNDDEDDHDEFLYSYYSLPNGDRISLNGLAPDNVKEGDKVYVTYKKIYSYGDYGDDIRCYDFMILNSVKKMRKIRSPLRLGNGEESLSEGWHLPSDAEWDKLDSISGAPGNDLKAKSGWDNCAGEDKFGFSALPGGNSGYNDGHSENDGFNQIGYGGFWWTATKIDNSIALSRYMNCLDPNTLYASNGKKSDLYSVRCVKD